MCLTLIVLEIKNNGFIWIEIDKPTRDQMKKLAERFPFHELNLEDCLSKIQIPKIDRYEDHVFVILNFPSLEKERIPRSSQLAVFIGSGFVRISQCLKLRVALYNYSYKEGWL
jgi:magnesium transporter